MANPFQRISPVSRANPVLSGMQFSSLAETTGGATMNLHTGRVLGPGEPGYIVGGEPDRNGKRVPTVHQHGPMDPTTAIRHRERLRHATDQTPASLGSWKDRKVPDSPHEVDMSAVYQDRRKAARIGRRRGEKAIWANGKMDEIRLDR